MKLKLAAIFSVQFIALVASAHTLDFHIEKGTVEKPWNSVTTPIRARVGDTIRFFNDDSVVHRLHTYGAPCEHGPDFDPGSTFDCIVTSGYSSSTDGPLYDHNYGESAEVWFEVTPL